MPWLATNDAQSVAAIARPLAPGSTRLFQPGVVAGRDVEHAAEHLDGEHLVLCLDEVIPCADATGDVDIGAGPPVPELPTVHEILGSPGHNLAW